MSCMRIFRLNKKGCYNLINAQNDHYIFELDNNFVETTRCLKMSSFKLRSKSDAFLVPWWLNMGNTFKYYITTHFFSILYLFT